MINKPLYIIIFVYIAGLSFLGGQFLADSYGITIRAPDGTPIRSNIVDIINVDDLNTASDVITNSTGAREDEFITDPIFAGATLAWELFLLLTGLEIFNIMYLFGIPIIFIIPITLVYIILLANTLIAKIRGV